jgi:ABC-type amino acid transport substrate-binding protein
MSTVIIVNPIAGGVRRSVAAARVELASQARDCHGKPVTVFVTECAGHARELARSSLNNGANRVVAWGGDGTINEVASALVGGGAALGIVPAGSGNGLARELGIDPRPARAIADALGAEVIVHWFPTERGMLALRHLYEGRCDLVMGLPRSARFTDDKPRLVVTTPYYVMRQVVVAPSVGGVSSSEELGGKLVGVQAMTLGDQLVYERGWNRKVYVKPDEVFAALVKSEVDAAVVESAFAGPFLKRAAGFRALAITDPRRELEIGAGVRASDRELKEAVEQAIQQLRTTVLPDILSRYGIVVAQAQPPTAQPALPSGAEPPTVSASPPTAPLTPELRAARSTYLTQCSQCHGTDATGTPAAANLKAFKGSEDDFVRVVLNGRPGTAMTPWKGLIADEDIRNIVRYIKGL